MVTCVVMLAACSSRADRTKAPSLPDAFERAAGAICTVYRDGKWNAETLAYESPSLGAGVAFREDGWIVTNTHVVRGGSSVLVVGPDGVGRTADRFAWDEYMDLAVVHVPGLQLVVPEAAERVRVGETVFAIGNPREYSRTLTAGVVSGLHRSVAVDGDFEWALEDYIQTDAQANPGSSGGGLFNVHGRLVGIVCSSLSVIDTQSPGMCFALPVGHVQRAARELVEKGEVHHAGLDIGRIRECSDLPEQVRNELGIECIEGVYVVEVKVDSGGERAGLQAGDHILRVDGENVVNYMHFRTLIMLRHPGDRARLSIRRSGHAQEIEVQLGSW